MEKLKQYFRDAEDKPEHQSKQFFLAALVVVNGLLVALSLLMYFMVSEVIAEIAVTSIAILISLTLLKIVSQNEQKH